MAQRPLTEEYWSESISNYVRSWIDLPDSELIRSSAGHEAIRELACNTLTHLAASNGFKRFVPGQIWGRELRPGISIHVDDGDVLRHIDFSIYMGEWSIETFLPNRECLPYMKDSFWRDIASLESYGEVELFEGSPINTPPNTTKRFMASEKSVVFQLVRNLIFRRQYGPDNVQEIGTLIVKWPIQTPFVELIPKLVATYGIYQRCARQLIRYAARRKTSQH